MQAGDLKKFPLAQLFVEGKMEEGPALTDVLKAAGVSDYQTIHLDGSSSPVDSRAGTAIAISGTTKTPMPGKAVLAKPVNSAHKPMRTLDSMGRTSVVSGHLSLVAVGKP